MTKEALQCFLDLLLLLLPKDCSLPSTVYLLEKHSKQNLTKPTDVYFCTICLEDMTQEIETFVCSQCNVRATKKKLKSQGGHYLLLSIEDQLRRYLQVFHDNSHHYLMCFSYEIMINR
jgi:hypothetical protein